MNSRVVSSSCLALAISTLSACSGQHRDSTESGAVRFTTTTIPSDVQCISLTASGSTVALRNFDVTPGQTGTFTATGLPTGAVTLAEVAYDAPCAQVTNETPPTWLSDAPVVVQLVPGQVTSVTMLLRRPGQIVIVTQFDDGVDAGVDGGKTDVPIAVDVVKYDVPITIDVVKYDVPVTVDVVKYDVPLGLDVIKYDVPLAVDAVRDDVPVTVDVVKYDVPVAVDVVKYDVPVAIDVVKYDVPLGHRPR